MTDRRGYQKDGSQYMREHPRSCNWDDAGLGKSCQAIDAADGRTLILSPAVVADNVWPDEVARWADDPSLFTISAYTRTTTRVKTEGVVRSGTKPTKDLAPLVADEYDTLILDESHYLSRRAYWTAAVQKIAARTPRVYMLTGSPFRQWAPQLFPVLQILHPLEAKAGGELGSYWRWAREWFDTEPTRFSQGKPVIGDLIGCTVACHARKPWDPCAHYLAFAKANLGDLFIRRTREEVLGDLPPLTVQTVHTHMSTIQRRWYETMKKDYVVWAADGREVSAWNDGGQNAKLAKLCAGPETLGLQGEGGKFRQLRHDLMSRSRPTFVVAVHQDTLNACSELAKKMKLSYGLVHGGISKAKQNRDIAAFKAGNLDVLFGSLEMVAEGLTLVAADMIIFMEQSWKNYRNTQAMQRIHRLGQERPCIARIYETPDSLDVGKREVLAVKDDKQVRVLTASMMARLL